MKKTDLIKKYENKLAYYKKQIKNLLDERAKAIINNDEPQCNYIYGQLDITEAQKNLCAEFLEDIK